VSPAFVAACDHALEADGALVKLFPAVVVEAAILRHERNIARLGPSAPLPFEAQHCDLDLGDDVDPTTRRGILGAGAAAGAAAALGVSAAPAAAREIDPDLPAHWTQLLDLLGRHDEMFGPQEVLSTVRHQLDVIAAHRQRARGYVRAELLRAEARGAEFAGWLSNDTGQARERDAWTDRALRLAQEANFADMIAYARSRQSQYAAQERDARRAIALADDALRVPGTSAQMRAWCALRAALGHALANDAADCERRLADAYSFVNDADSAPPPWAGQFRYTDTAILGGQALCWLWMQPRKAIPLYESVLRDWPLDETRTGGLHRARLARACAAAGEHDRATAEGRKALAIARRTRSATTASELRRLRDALQN